MPDRLSLTLVQLVFEGISVDYREPLCSVIQAQRLTCHQTEMESSTTWMRK